MLPSNEFPERPHQQQPQNRTRRHTPTVCTRYASWELSYTSFRDGCPTGLLKYKSSRGNTTCAQRVTRGLRRLSAIELGKLALQQFEFGHIHRADVTVVGMMNEIVLVIILRVVKDWSGYDLRHNGVLIEFRCVELSDIHRGNFLLLFRRIKNCRAILRSDIWPLAIFLRRVVGDAEENHQELAVGDARTVVNDTHAFRVSCRTGTNDLVVRVLDSSAAVTGCDFLGAAGTPDTARTPYQTKYPTTAIVTRTRGSEGDFREVSII